MSMSDTPRRRTRNLHGSAYINLWSGASKTRAYHGPSLSAKEAKARQIDRLPATATSFYDDLDFFGWGAKLRELLIGTRDRSCELYKLRGQEDTLLRYIFSFVARFFDCGKSYTAY